MFKKIQRLSDLKYLSSIDENIWVDNINQSTIYTLNEFKNVMSVLLSSYQENDLKVYTSFNLRRN
jgi:hypothetical protein